MRCPYCGKLAHWCEIKYKGQKPKEYACCEQAKREGMAKFQMSERKGKANFDLDLVLEGDAINLAKQLHQPAVMKLTTHPHFGAAKLQWGKWSVDLTTARSETYPKPGALPKVEFLYEAKEKKK